MPYSEADIRRAFDAPTFAAGLRDWRGGKVVALEHDAPNRALLGRVLGPQESAYSVTARVKPQGLVSLCSCAVGNQCKHGAALLLANLADRQPNGQPNLDRWLEQVSSAARSGDKARPIGYYLSLPAGREAGVTVECRRPGTTARGGKHDALAQAARGQRPTDIRLADWTLLQRLVALTDATPRVAHLRGENSAELFDALVASGHCYFEGARRPLRWGEDRVADPRWQLQDDGSQCLRFVPREDCTVLPLAPLRYVDRRDQRCGQLNCGLNAEMVAALIQAPRIRPEDLDSFLSLLNRHPVAGLPRPQRPAHKQQEARPQPVLELLHLEDLLDPGVYCPDWYVASLRVRCGERLEPAGKGPRELTQGAGDTLLRWHRDLTAENALLNELPGFERFSYADLPDDASTRMTLLRPEDPVGGWARFLAEDMPRLREAGWDVEMRDSFQLALCDTQDWQLQIDAQDGDWLSVSAQITTDGQTVDLIPLLRDAGEGLSATDDQLTLVLDAQRLLRLPRKPLEPLLELGQLRGRGARLHRLDAARLGQQAESGSDWSLSADLQALARELLAEPATEPDIAADFRGTLRQYQREGLAWLQQLDRLHLGGILADDMGLGKTVQTLAWLVGMYAREPAAKPSLIVAPTSVLGNWQAEAAQFSPALRQLLWHGSKRAQQSLNKADLVITSYATLQRDGKLLSARQWRCVVLDEAQYIKNPRARISSQVRQLKADQRLCLSGTPMENHLGELWSLMDFLVPGFLGSAEQFQRDYRKPIERDGDEHAAAALARRIQPLVLRRLKEDVARDLPPKNEMIRQITLNPRQVEIYNQVLREGQADIEAAIADQGLAQSQITIFDVLLKLRQVCCDPRLLKPARPRPGKSAKLEALLDMLDEMLASGRRILLFSQFTSMLSLIEAALDQAGHPYQTLTGASRNRQALVDRFQAGEVPLFLISLKAGGTGLNLTAADTVIHYDPWWNPAVEDQATDRSHRIGQDKPVFVYRLICRDSIEDRIRQRQLHKRALGEQLLGSGQTRISEADLQALLHPVGK